jgi:hypothetical protein
VVVLSFMDRSFLPLTWILITAAASPLTGCGGASSAGAPAKPPDTAGEAASAPSQEEAPQGAAAKTEEAPATSGDASVIPTKCADGHADGICAPPRSYVKALCDGYPKPDIALVLFSKSSPWTRAYMNRNLEAWYTSGQQSTSAKLVFDEEVIVLAHLKPRAGGMVIGNGGTPYDVLRIDGVCSSVETEAITMRRPPSPKYAIIPWQHLEKNVRDALLADPNIAKADANRRKECKGTTSLGVISPSCAKADDRLSATIADYIVHGGQSPLPKTAR